MSNTNENRLKSPELDADLSVLGDDRGGQPQQPRVGAAPEPRSKEGLRQAVKPDSAGPDTNDDDRTKEEIDQYRAEKESIHDVVEGYGKG